MSAGIKSGSETRPVAAAGVGRGFGWRHDEVVPVSAAS